VVWYVSFIETMNTNNGFNYWPQWKDGKQILNNRKAGAYYINDTFRNESYEFIARNLVGEGMGQATPGEINIKAWLTASTLTVSSQATAAR